MMEINGIEISEKEFKALSKILPLTKSHLAKIVPVTKGKETSSKIYVPKDWAGARVIILNLDKKSKT